MAKKYTWQQWLEIEDSTKEIIALAYDDYFGFDGLNKLVYEIKDQYLEDDQPLNISVCKPLYFELKISSLIEAHKLKGIVDLEEWLCEKTIDFTYCLDTEWDKELKGVEELQRAVDFFNTAHYALRWLFVGWGIVNLMIFPLAFLLERAIRSFNAKNRKEWVLYQPTDDEILLDDDYYKIYHSEDVEKEEMELFEDGTRSKWETQC
jgi:hypothetical protein